MPGRNGLEVGSSFPCVETKILKMEKGNAWNALKQEMHIFISSNITFKNGFNDETMTVSKSIVCT